MVFPVMYELFMSDNFSVIRGIITMLQAKDVSLEYHHFISSAYPSAELTKDFLDLLLFLPCYEVHVFHTY